MDRADGTQVDLEMIRLEPKALQEWTKPTAFEGRTEI